MATVVFSTVGQAIGGPAGATVGALAGGAVDGAIFGHGTRQLPAEDLVASASYGTSIPRIFGRARVAGTLIWALPMTRAGGGKAGGQRRYVTSFAVALSSGPIMDVRRIWADGREVRDADGVDAFQMTVRIHDGRRQMLPDARLVAAMGREAAAHAGLAQVVFEDFPLGLFGNRIPALSFEVVADLPDVGPDRWLRMLARDAGIDAEAGGVKLAAGLVAGAATYRQDADTIALAADLWPGAVAGRARWRGLRTPTIIPRAALLMDEDETPGLSLQRDRVMRPGSAAVGYFDPARDYLLGEQRSSRAHPGRLSVVGSGLVASAPMARGLADRSLRRGEAITERLTLRLPWTWLGIEPGERVKVEGLAGEWQVITRRIVALLVELDCCRACEAISATAAADPGAALRQPAAPVGPTRLALAELPMALQGTGSGAGVLVLAGGAPAWTGAAIDWQLDQQVGTLSEVRESLVRGVLLAPVGTGPATVWDEANEIELVLDDEGSWLESRTSAGLLSGANLALLGDELVQFRTATELAAGRYRLTGLLRGRQATAASMHAAGTPFWLLEGTPSAIAVELDRAGQLLVVRATGPGDTAGGVLAEHRLTGVGEAPLAPCHVRVTRLPGGDIEAAWVKRSRSFFAWADAKDAGDLSYECLMFPTNGPSVRLRTTEQFVRWPLAAQLALLGAPAGAASVQLITAGDGPEALRAAPPVWLPAP